MPKKGVNPKDLQLSSVSSKIKSTKTIVNYLKLGLGKLSKFLTVKTM